MHIHMQYEKVAHASRAWAKFVLFNKVKGSFTNPNLMLTSMCKLGRSRNGRSRVW